MTDDPIYDPDDLLDDDPNDPLDCDLDDDAAEPTIDCPACGRAVFEEANQCPHCGHWITEADLRRPLPVVWTIAAVLAILGLLWITLW